MGVLVLAFKFSVEEEGEEDSLEQQAGISDRNLKALLL